MNKKVDNIILIDPDKIEISNLNRTIFEYSDIGCYKVDAVALQIIKRRPNYSVFVYKELMDSNLVKKINSIYI